MAVKAICTAYFVQYDPSNSGKFRANLSVAGIDATAGLVDTGIFIDNVDPTLSSVLLEQAIKQRVKDELTNNHGYTFGLFDSVRLLTALL